RRGNARPNAIANNSGCGRSRVEPDRAGAGRQTHNFAGRDRPRAVIRYNPLLACCAWRPAMSVSPAAAEATPSGSMMFGCSDLLVRRPVFRTRDLEQGRVLLGEHGVVYLSRERSLDLRHRQAKVGSIGINSLQYGAGVIFSAPLLPDFYLLQFTLDGECHLWQQRRHSVLPAGSVAIVNPGQG